ncbi:hypothetical protein ACMUMJ_05295 [Marinomonas sp. 2405UD68-3]
MSIMEENRLSDWPDHPLAQKDIITEQDLRGEFVLTIVDSTLIY